MRRTARTAPGAAFVLVSATLACTLAPAPPPFAIEDATIADIHTALAEGATTCRDVIQRSLDRIDAYDKRGPALNALITISPTALERADELDRARADGRTPGALDCVPVIVKDNFDTMDLATTAGSLSLAGFRPERDAFQVARIREAGGVILAKSNMAEFAFSPYETVGSMLPGYTRNPYDLARVTAGSSGGTAAAVAAGFGTVGLGSDTGNSIRGPSSHQALVGIRSTMGLTSRAGVVPLNLAADIAGPMTRTVADAAAVLEVIEGYDPRDPVTAASVKRTHAPYASSLGPGGLAGARLGVLRVITDSETADPEVLSLFEGALGDLAAEDATLVDPFEIPGLDEHLATRRGGCSQFKSDLNAYLDTHGGRAPVASLAEIIGSRRFHPSIRARLESGEAARARAR